MADLSIRIGTDARTALCAAFDSATTSICAEFYSIDDPAVVDSLNRAADRGVRVQISVEGEPHRYRRGHAREPDARALRGGLDENVDVLISRQPNPLVHAKAAVVDRSVALVATANVRPTGFDAPGEVLVIDKNVSNVWAVEAKLALPARMETDDSALRSQLDAFLNSKANLRIASEDLSDVRVVHELAMRARRGFHDRVLVSRNLSKCSVKLIRWLQESGVAVRTTPSGYMHEKFVDGGDRIYVGSANLTRNGIDEAYEIGVVASPSDFDDGGTALRANFEQMWSTSISWSAQGEPGR